MLQQLVDDGGAFGILDGLDLMIAAQPHTMFSVGRYGHDDLG